MNTKSTRQSAKRLTLDQLSSLPVTKEARIGEDYLDANQHMNVSWYLHLFHRAAAEMHRWLGINWSELNENHTGVFILEGHIRYLAEVLFEQHVSVRSRIVAVSPERMQLVHVMFNDDTRRVAATYEEVQAFMDLKARCMAPFPDAIASKLQTVLAEHQALDWDPPICGAMQV